MLLTLLSGCGSDESLDLSAYPGRNGKPARFTLCHGYGCEQQSKIRLSRSEWAQVRMLFSPAAADAAAERRQIAMAVARLETLAGGKTGTDRDESGAALLGRDPFQLDCIDETANTSLYLRFLHDGDLLSWHEPSEPLRRGYFIDAAWPHNTAAVREKGSGQVFAVDTWFGKNGDEPFIIEADRWLKGARPRSSEKAGGWGEIRTHGKLAPSPVFKTGALNRSATHPLRTS